MSSLSEVLVMLGRTRIARITRILPSRLSFAHRMRITRMPCGVIVEYMKQSAEYNCLTELPLVSSQK